MADEPIYTERVTSKRTQVFFLALTLLSASLGVWRAKVAGWDALAVVLACFSCFFFFYTLNYRMLVIRFTPGALRFTYGVFTWRVPVDNIEACALDEMPVLMKYGGAGIHFMVIRKRYRASFNFLEHPRVVVALKRKVGPVRDISFSSASRIGYCGSFGRL